MTLQNDLFKEPREGQRLLTIPTSPRAWARAMGGKTKQLFTPPALQAYYHEIRSMVIEQLPLGWMPFSEACRLEVYLGKGWSQLRVVIDPHGRRLLRGDLSNYLKSHEDGLQGVLWLNDKQICEVHVEEVDVELTEVP